MLREGTSSDVAGRSTRQERCLARIEGRCEEHDQRVRNCNVRRAALRESLLQWYLDQIPLWLKMIVCTWAAQFEDRSLVGDGISSTSLDLAQKRALRSQRRHQKQPPVEHRGFSSVGSSS